MLIEALEIRYLIIMITPFAGITYYFSVKYLNYETVMQHEQMGDVEDNKGQGRLDHLSMIRG
jgi:hypothetical protein